MKRVFPHVLEQLDYVIKLQGKRSRSRYLNQAHQKNINKYFDWTQKFISLYLASRTERADDIIREEMQRVMEIAYKFNGNNKMDFIVSCVDGRNMPTVMLSEPPRIGEFLRTPAGALTGFMEGAKQNTTFIDKESLTVQKITKLIKTKPQDTIYFCLDSHVGCAARGLIYSTEGGELADAGLRSDVKNKMTTARGILNIVESVKQNFDEAANAVPVFFSYDPHIGYMYMGLEINVHNHEVAGKGYTAEILEQLSNDGLIVSTKKLIKNPAIKKELAEFKFQSLDFRNHYAESMLNNWQVIYEFFTNKKLKTFGIIVDSLNNAYRKGAWSIGISDNFEEKLISKNTIEHNAKLLLKNLVTRYSIAGDGDKWPFDVHKEDLIVIVDGGYAPFSKLDAFSVFSQDSNSLIPNTKLTIDLIRSLRKNGSSKNPIDDFKFSQEEFVAAPVIISNKTIFKSADKFTWEELLRIDLSFLENLDWDDVDVMGYGKEDIERLLKESLREQSIRIDFYNTIGFVDEVYELFDRFRMMMRDKYFRHMILYGNIFVLNTIVDVDRRPRMIVPFIV